MSRRWRWPAACVVWLLLASGTGAQTLHAVLVGDVSEWARWGEFLPNVQLDPVALLTTGLSSKDPEAGAGMCGIRGIGMVVLVGLALPGTVAPFSARGAEPAPASAAPASAAQPSVAQPSVAQPSGPDDDWAGGYLAQDPLAAKAEIGYDDLLQALQDPASRESVLPRHLPRAQGLADQELKSLLRAALENESPAVRRQAAVELQRRGLLEEAVRDLLFTLARSDSPELRQAAIVALECVHIPQPPDDYWTMVIEALGADDFLVSEAAANQLRDQGALAVPALLEALRGEDAAIRQQAALLLGDIAGSKVRRSPAMGGPAMAAPMAPALSVAPGPVPRMLPAPGDAITKSVTSSDAGEHSVREVDDQQIKQARVYFGTNREVLQTAPPRLWPAAVVFVLACLALLGYPAVVLRRRRRARQSGETPRRSFSLVLIASLLVLACWSGVALNSAVQQRWALGSGITFGPHRSPGGTIYYGQCDVTLPSTHTLGEVERPLLGPEDETRHVVLQQTERLEETEFYQAIQRALETRELDARDCFIFVHGFNVSFDDAARRTAQIHHDLKFPGVPMFYSWPSRAGLRHYPSDRNEVGYSQEHIKRFLLGVADNIQARRIHIIAHSMGGAAVCQALAEIDRPEVIFDQIVLAAPDIDADVFREQLLPRLGRHGRRTTLYCSRNDLALHMSYAFNDYPRAGDSSRVIVTANGLDTVDASGIDTDLLGHSYYGDAVRLLDDVALLLRQNLPPTSPERHLRPLTALEGAVYWIFGE